MDTTRPGWLTTDAFAELARRHSDGLLTPTKIKRSQQRGELPRYQRVGQAGQRGIWLSPPEATTVLLARLDKRSEPSPDDVVAAWLDGTSVSDLELRKAMGAALDKAVTTLVQAAEWLSRADRPAAVADGNPHEALRLLASKLVRCRGEGRRILPLGRIPAQVRETAVATLFSIFLSGEPPAGVAMESDVVQRGLGLLPRGRKDRPRIGGERLGPWHPGAGDLVFLTQVMSVHALREAVRTASPDDLEIARRTVRPITLGLAAFARILQTFTGNVHVCGWDMITRERMEASSPALLLAAILSLLQSDGRDNLIEIVEGLERIRTDLPRLVNELARWRRRHRIGLPPRDVDREADKVVAAAAAAGYVTARRPDGRGQQPPGRGPLLRARQR